MLIAIKANNNKKGMTLIELMVTTVVIALMAALSFPTYKIIQQKSKERRLKKILYEVRRAIAAGGWRSYILSKVDSCIKDIRDALPTDTSEKCKGFCAEFFKKKLLKLISEQITFYPPKPKYLSKPGFQVPLLKWVDEAALEEFKNEMLEEWVNLGHEASELDSLLLGLGDILNNHRFGGFKVEQRFLRGEPVHPFKGWAPAAEFVYIPAQYSKDEHPEYKDGLEYGNDGNSNWGTNATGVIDIRSKYAGVALDGTNTNDW